MSHKVAILFSLLAALALASGCKADPPNLGEVGGVVLTYEVDWARAGVPEWDRPRALEMARGIIARRLEALEQTATVQTRGGQIIVQLVGQRDTDALPPIAKDVSFRPIDTVSPFFADQRDAVERWHAKYAGSTLEVRGGDYRVNRLACDDLAELKAFIATLELPEDRLVGFERQVVKQGRVVTRVFWITHLVDAKPALDGRHIAEAEVIEDHRGRPAVSVSFDDAGAKAFEQLTTKLVKLPLAVMLGDEVRSAPIVNEPIAGGRARIDLGADAVGEAAVREATELTVVLRAGAVQTPLELIKRVDIGPARGTP